MWKPKDTRRTIVWHDQKETFLNFKCELCQFSSFCLSFRGLVRCSCRISHHRRGWMDIALPLWILMRLSWWDTLSAVQCYAVRAALIVADYWMTRSQLYTSWLCAYEKLRRKWHKITDGWVKMLPSVTCFRDEKNTAIPLIIIIPSVITGMLWKWDYYYFFLFRWRLMK